MNKKVIKLAFCGMFAAIIAIMTFITIPSPIGINFTLQTFAIALCGYMLGTKYGLISTLVYMAVGFMGLPIFSGFRGGFAVLVSPTGGFLVGFIPFVILCGLGLRRKTKVMQITLGVIGQLTCHLFGIIQFAYISNVSFYESFILLSMNFLVKDFLSVIAGYFVAIALKKALFKAGLQL